MRDGVHEDEVLGLEIAMDNKAIVTIVESFEDALDGLGGVFLGVESLVLQVLKELSASQVLQYKVHIQIVLVDLVQLDHVGMIDTSQNVDFTLH